MKEIASLMEYRSGVKVVDATLRDGGLVNDFYFTDEFVKDLYQTNVKAGVDYMEFGYKADKEIFDEKQFGKWKFCKDEDIRAIVGDNNTDLKIAVMADVGRCNYKEDIHEIRIHRHRQHGCRNNPRHGRGRRCTRRHTCLQPHARKGRRFGKRAGYSRVRYA